MLSNDTINQPMAQRMAAIRNKINPAKLLVHEVYSSIQGESSYMGLPCTFVRTTGCHLRCAYCDTEHAFFRGSERSLDDIMAAVSAQGLRLVELTGGEPLLQKSSFILLDRLVHAGFTVLLETSGAVAIKKVNREVKVILDVKTPASLESNKNLFANLEILWPGCEVKFVISDALDYAYAKKICDQYDLYERTHVLFSPVMSRLNPAILADMIVADRLPVRFQIQLHRVLYGEAPGK